MRTTTILATLAIGLTGCASNSGIVPVGGGRYMASTMNSMAWSGGGLKADLFREAAAFCEKRGKEFQLMSSSGEDATLGGRYASAEIQFRCD